MRKLECFFVSCLFFVGAPVSVKAQYGDGGYGDYSANFEESTIGANAHLGDGNLTFVDDIETVVFQQPLAARPDAMPPLRMPTTMSPGTSPRSSVTRPDAIRATRRTRPAAVATTNDRSRIDHVPLWTDSPSAGLTVVVNDGLIATTNLPLAGGARRLRMADNNRAMPMDRIIFSYQHFEDAFTADASNFIVGPDARTQSLEQITVGFEKTFADGCSSVDIRMPFTNRLSLDTPNFGVEGGTVGNLNIKLKRALWLEPNLALSLGLGIEAPTGQGVLFQGNGIPYEIRNNAAFLAPFIAYEERVSRFFFNGFLSTDVPLNGNQLRFAFPFGNPLGRINDQTLLVCNLGTGVWLYQDNSQWLRGCALATELNYTTTLQDSDNLVSRVNFQSATLLNQSNRSDVLNLTVGTQLNIAESQLRFAFVQPLRDDFDKPFDNEFTFQWNRLF